MQRLDLPALSAQAVRRQDLGLSNDTAPTSSEFNWTRLKFEVAVDHFLPMKRRQIIVAEHPRHMNNVLRPPFYLEEMCVRDWRPAADDKLLVCHFFASIFRPSAALLRVEDDNQVNQGLVCTIGTIRPLNQETRVLYWSIPVLSRAHYVGLISISPRYINWRDARVSAFAALDYEFGLAAARVNPKGTFK